MNNQRTYTRLISVVSVVLCLTFTGEIARAHEGVDEHIVAITKKIKRDPKNALLYLQRGELYRVHRNWSRAAADYDRAARLQPGLTIVDLARGRMFFESGKFSRAKFVLDRFLRQRPNDVEGLTTRARVFAKLAARTEAVDDFTRAIALMQPPEPELYLERAEVLAGDIRFVQDALRGLDEGIKRLGPLVTLQLAAIDIEVRSKNYDAALTRLDLIAAKSERKETWLVRRGEILKAAGRNEEARNAFNAALMAIDTLPPARRNNRAINALQLRARSGLRM